MAAWVMGWCNNILRSYPEMSLAFACIFFLIHAMRSRKRHVIVIWRVFRLSRLLNLHRFNVWCTKVLAKRGLTFVIHGPWFNRIEILLTCDPENINYIMLTNFSNFPKGPEFLKIFDVLGDGIFNSESDSWRFQRKMGNVHFKGSRFRRFMGMTLKQKVEKALFPVLEHIEQQGAYVDLQDVFQRLMFDSSCILVLGTDSGSLSIDFPEVPIVKAMDDATEAVLFRHFVPESWWRLLRWLKIGKERKLWKAEKTIDYFMYQCISSRRQQEIRKPNDGLEESCDILKSYMEEIGESKSDKFLRDAMLSFLFAARDTSSSGLTWFFWMISKNPRAEAKILEELRSITTRNGEACIAKPIVFEPEELSGLVYLHAALCETLRLFPPVPFNHKGVLRQDVLPSGETVRPGTRIVVPFYSMGRMEAIWGKDCLEFKPERWINECGSLKFVPSYEFAVFSTGPRNCLGRNMAFTQMKTVAAAVLYNFHVQVQDGHPVSPKVSVVLLMKDGLMVRVSKRRC